MYRPRVIPFLLLKDGGLVKSVKFRNHRYIGDPINAVRIFNDLKADEIAFIDIEATIMQRMISLDFVKSVGEEANMPFSVGGGIRKLEDIRQTLEAGAEKVIINTVAFEDPSFISKAANEFGSSSIAVCMDVKNDFWGSPKVWVRRGKKSTNLEPTVFAKQMENHGAGELIIQSIERDGTMLGYDISLISKVSQSVSIPVTALGGAGKLSDMSQLNEKTMINGLAAGSMFVYHGSRNAVLVNYPNHDEILNTLKKYANNK